MNPTRVWRQATSVVPSHEERNQGEKGGTRRQSWIHAYELTKTGVNVTFPTVSGKLHDLVLMTDSFHDTKPRISRCELHTKRADFNATRPQRMTTEETHNQQQTIQEIRCSATKQKVTMSASRIALRRISALSVPRTTLGARPFTSLGETLTQKVRFRVACGHVPQEAALRHALGIMTFSAGTLLLLTRVYIHLYQ